MKRLNAICRAVLVRAFFERVRCHRMNRMKVKGRFISFMPFSPKEREAFIKLIREGWNGDERSLPHRPGCEVLFRDEDHPGSCSCGITQLARNQVLRFFLAQLRWQGRLASICSRRFSHPGTTQSGRGERPSNSTRARTSWTCPDLGLIGFFLRHAMPPYLLIRELSGEVQIRGRPDQAKAPE